MFVGTWEGGAETRHHWVRNCFIAHSWGYDLSISNETGFQQLVHQEATVFFYSFSNQIQETLVGRLAAPNLAHAVVVSSAAHSYDGHTMRQALVQPAQKPDPREQIGPYEIHQAGIHSYNSLGRISDHITS